MAFTEHKIQNFKHKIADLADQPNMTAAELKARFDSSPEELRQAHNAICDEAARLDARVAGIVAETFGDSIPKSMLSAELAAEIDAKAEQTALAAEAEARAEGDTALSARLGTVETQKCEIYFGTYTGSGRGSTKNISLGFRPKAVLVSSHSTYGNYVQPGMMNLAVGSTDAPNVKITENGFQARSYFNCTSDDMPDMNPYSYLALK